MVMGVGRQGPRGSGWQRGGRPEYPKGLSKTFENMNRIEQKARPPSSRERDFRLRRATARQDGETWGAWRWVWRANCRDSARRRIEPAGRGCYLMSGAPRGGTRPTGSTSAFIPLAELRRDRRVVDISILRWFFAMQVFDFLRVADKLNKICVYDWLSSVYDCSRKSLIFRHLPPFSAIFHPFLTCKGVDLPQVTEKTPDFFAGGAVSISDCVRLRSEASAGQGFSETSASPSTGSGWGSIEPCGLGKMFRGAFRRLTAVTGIREANLSEWKEKRLECSNRAD
jgi:hypothetical protein